LACDDGAMPIQPLAAPPFRDSRNALRHPVQLYATLRERTSARFPVMLTNLSCSGFLAETVHPLEPRDKVWLTIPGFSPLEAVVARADFGAYGCAFKLPLHPAVFDHIVAMGRPD